MKKISEVFDKKNLKPLLLESGLYIVLFLILLGIIIKDPTFLRPINLINILNQSSTRLIMALGVAGIIILQGTDLSLGRLVGMTALVTATLVQVADTPTKVFKGFGTLPLPLVLLIVVIIGMLFGLLNGFIVSKLDVVPFIATMGTMVIVYGANSLYYDYIGNQPVASFTPAFSNMVNNRLFNIPYLVFYALIAMIIIWVIYNKTVFGKNLYAVGGNPEAARVSGVNVVLTFLIVYVLAGGMYAIGGFLEVARIGSATNNIGFMYELDAIAACVVGGVSFNGGRGKVSGIVTGVLIFTVINYGLTYIGVSPYWQYIIKGLIIIGAVAIDGLKYKKHN